MELVNLAGPIALAATLLVLTARKIDNVMASERHAVWRGGMELAWDSMVDAFRTMIETARKLARRLFRRQP